MNKHIVTAMDSMCEDLCLPQSSAQRLIEGFLKGLPASLAEIKNADFDMESLRTAIHTLKGNSANMRMKKLHSICVNLEQSLMNDDKDETKRLIDALDTEIQTTLSDS